MPYYCTYRFPDGATPEAQIDSLLSTITADGDPLLRIVFFAAPADNEAYEQMAEAVLRKVGERFGKRRPAVSLVAQPVLYNGTGMAAEVHRMKRDAVRQVEYKSAGELPYVVVTTGDARYLMLGGVRGRTGDPIRVQSDVVFAAVKTILSAEGFGVSEIVRQWNYIERITRIDARGVQHYQAFNDARSLFYAVGGWPGGYPAATGIGAQCGGVVVDLIAAKPLEGGRLEALPVNNSLQIAAHSYSCKVLLGKADERVQGPTTPKFERAKVLREPAGEICFVSGTAAIRGENSVDGADVARQTEVTLDNIDFLISAKNLLGNGIAATGPFALNCIRVYVREGVDSAGARQVVEGRCGGVETLYIVADVCRDELLVEVEGVAGH